MDKGAEMFVREALGPADDELVCLMVRPDILVDRIDERFAVVFDPVERRSLQLSRPVYELFYRFYRPSRIADVLPAGGVRDRALGAVRQLRASGILIPWDAAEGSPVPVPPGGLKTSDARCPISECGYPITKHFSRA